MAEAYLQLTGAQRCKIETLLACQWSQSQIAQYLNVSKSTSSRELERNRTANQPYDANAAHQQATQRRINASSQACKYDADAWARVDEILDQEQWSPKQIAGRLRHQDELEISHTWIYSHIRRN